MNKEEAEREKEISEKYDGIPHIILKIDELDFYKVVPLREYEVHLEEYKSKGYIRA